VGALEAEHQRLSD
jgi:glutaredoxin 2